MKEQCLISVVILSYNSEKFIEDTLNSIFCQTYSCIELIISDDASQDGTLMIAEEWLKQNHNRFTNSLILKSKENKGIPCNLNRGIKCANGKYIKSIAGDDILEPSCLETAYEICEEQGYHILFSNMVSFYNSWETGAKETMAWDEHFFELSVSEKKEKLCFQNILYAPTAFYQKALIEKMGYFDEQYKYMEDYPMWVKILENGFDIAGKNFISVFYRRHQEAITNVINNKQAVNVRFHADDKRFFYNKRYSVLKENKNYKRILYMRVKYFFDDMILSLGNKRNIFIKVILKIKVAVLWCLTEKNQS